MHGGIADSPNDERRRIYQSSGSIGTPTKRPLYIYVVTILSAVGGFLFGYDTGVVSGAMILIKTEFSLTPTWQELIISATVALAWLFSLLTGYMADYLGRKPVILLASFVFTAGAILMGIALNKYVLLGGRIIVGAGIGIASMSVPMYIGEVAPADIRGSLVTLNNICIACGQFVASLVCGAFSQDKVNGWRYMLGLAAVPSFLQFFGFLLMPESPRWLISKLKYERAISVLRSIRGETADIEHEFDAIKSNCIEVEREQESATGTILFQVLKAPPLRRALILGCLLQVFQQICGINTVMYYSATIIQMAGFHDPSMAIWLSAATSGVNFFVGFIGIYLVERIGRRPLILGSMAGVIVGLAILSGGFQAADMQSPPITSQDDSAIGSVCYSLDTCASCVTNSNCGYCFNDTGHKPYNGTCSMVNPDNTNQAHSGPCNVTTLVPPLTFGQWCPSKLGYVILFGLILYLFFFAPGMGPMPWTVNAEIYPLWARSTCFAVSTSFNWLFNLLVSMTFLTLTETITKYGTFWLYTGLAVIGWLTFYWMLPETKGKSLEEVESLFADSWWRDRTTSDERKVIQTAVSRQDDLSSPIANTEDPPPAYGTINNSDQSNKGIKHVKDSNGNSLIICEITKL